jgi:hypothetical protein
LQEFRSCRSSGVAGVQEFRSSGVQEFRSSGVQEFRSSRLAKFGWNQALIFELTSAQLQRRFCNS